MAALVDTNVLVYRFDPRFPLKQRAAEEILRQGRLRQGLGRAVVENEEVMDG